MIFMSMDNFFVLSSYFYSFLETGEEEIERGVRAMALETDNRETE